MNKWMIWFKVLWGLLGILAIAVIGPLALSNPAIAPNREWLALLFVAILIFNVTIVLGIGLLESRK